MRRADIVIRSSEGPLTGPLATVHNAAEAERAIAALLGKDYDPTPNLVAKGIVSADHDPESCEAACCEHVI